MTRQVIRRLGSRLRRRAPATGIGGTPQANTATASRSGSGGTGRGPQAGTVAFELAPYVPSAADPFDLVKAAHLMRRAGFGGKSDELATIVNIGVHRTVDLLVIPANWGLQTFGSQMLPTGEVLNLHNNLSHQQAQWIYEAAHTHFPLKEKMALFFHDHFSVGVNSSLETPLLPPHINIFRRHGLGRFRDILIEVSRDPAMLYWLDNRINGAGRQATVNENYGREILELYSLGVNGGYTQADVYDTSRCFAGWSLNYYNQFLYRPAYANAGAGVKNVLGTQIYNPSNQEREGYLLIDVLLQQKSTARYLVSKIWSYFVAERPPTNAVEQKLWDDVVEELATRWQAVDYDLRALMSTILRCNYFFSARAYRKLVKNPMEYLVGAIRGLGAPFIGRYSVLGVRLEAMGMPLFRYSNPSGHDDGVAWIDSQALINRSTFADDLTQVSTAADFRANWNPVDDVQRFNLTTRQAIVDHYIKVLVDDDVPAAVRQNLMDFMDYYDGTPRVYSPYDQLASNSQYRVTKIRGLVHLLMTLPEYSLN
jgi:uncharacterized protein (DUF1800 family)